MVGDDFTVAENFATHYPCPHGPTGELDAVPRTPATFCNLSLIADFVGAVEVDQHEIGIVTDSDAALAVEIPDTGGSVAHPMDDLLECTAAAVDFIEHQRE